MTFLYSFYTEFVIFCAIAYFFVMALGSTLASKQEFYSRFIYRQLVIMLIIILFALCTSEGHWHFVLQPLLLEDDIPFYPTTFLVTTFLGFISKVTLLILTIACVLLHKPTAALRSRIAIEYSILILFITLASFLLISSTNLAFAFVAMELQTLSLVAFAYIGHQRKTLTAEATFRYFVNAAFASVSFLFAISILYAITGTLQIEQLALFFQTQVFTSITPFLVLIIVSAVLLFFALFFKLTLAPFHHWVGDLYQGTSGYVGSYFTLVTKIPM